MGILVITVDLDCCRCRAKITKVLDCLEEEFNIEKVEFDDKKEKKVVVVRGKFDAEKLCKKIWCKAGKIVKAIAIVEVWPPPKPEEAKPPKPEEPKPEKKCCGCEHCKPKPPEKCCCACCDHCKPKPKPEEPKPKPKPEKCCCSCEHCKPKPKPEEPKPKPEEPKPKPPPAKTEYKFVPYPYPLPCQSWPWQCPPHQPCQFCQKPPPPTPTPPPPPPPAAAPKPCSCSSHASCGCGQTPPVWPPQPQYWPPPWAGCSVVADDNSCSVM